MGRLSGKIVLITGAARGQGGAQARLCAQEVILTDVLDVLDAGVSADILSKGCVCCLRI